MRAPTADRLVALDRTYDPTTGTFLSPDPVDGQPGTPDEANAYDYVGNDPLNFTDPLGLSRVSDQPPGTASCDSFFRSEMGGEVSAELGLVNCLELPWALTEGCLLRGGTHYTFDFDRSWQTGCQVFEGMSCSWRCDVNNVAGGALQANPMYWVADGVDGQFGVELDLQANQGVNPDSGWYQVGFWSQMALNAVVGAAAASAAENAAMTYCLSGAWCAAYFGGGSVTGTATVTSWASSNSTPDLQNGRWVVIGGPTRLSHIRSGTWGPGFGYPFSNSITGTAQVGLPEGSWLGGGPLIWKSLLGQRVIVGSGS